MGKWITRKQTIALLCVGILLAAFGLPPGCGSSAPQAPPAYLLQWGDYGPYDMQFNSPGNVAVDTAGNVYVSDCANNRVQKFSSAGVFILTWGTYGTADGRMKYPTGIAVDSSGNVYVIDSYNYRVQEFSNTGVFLAKWGSYGTADGQFIFPRGIAIDASNNVFVADGQNDSIQKFSSTGAFITKWGSYGNGNGEFEYVRSIAVDATGNVYAADYSNDRIEKFSNTGVFLGKWGSYGTGAGKFKGAYGVAVDSAGNVYATDLNNNRVQKFNSVGSFLSIWGTTGTANGQFNSPYGIAVDAAKNVYVVDGDNNRLEKFGYPIPDSVIVNATLDGAPWTGAANFTVTGPQTISGTSVSQTSTVAAGSYTMTYNSGGPPGATLLGSSPATPQALVSGGSITFTLNFKNPTNVVVNATLNGLPWTGSLNYNVEGIDLGGGGYIPTYYTGSASPQTFANVLQGTNVVQAPDPNTGIATIGYAAFYNIQYVFGGPSGATLFSVTPSGMPVLFTGHTLTFTLNFRTEGFISNSITVNATLDGAPWTGPVSFDLQGLLSFSPSLVVSPIYVGSTAPQTFAGMLPGSFTITDPSTLATGQGGLYSAMYISGGPPGATFTSITPSSLQGLINGTSQTITLNFKSNAARTGTIAVNAILDGSPWTGAIGFALTGPSPISGSSVPLTSPNMPVGAYTIGSITGGPGGATLLNTTPSVTQTLTAGGTITYTLNFRSNKVDTGTVTVNATLNGSPWTGAAVFALTGPSPVSGTSVPLTTPNMPAGSYTLTYTSGGPSGASFVGITTMATQTLAAGGSITYTLNFATKTSVSTGTIVVNATQLGPVGTVPWTGPVIFTLTGPQTIPGVSVSQTFANVPVGTYTLTYVSGGPPGVPTTTPSVTQTLTAGGTITFTINFQ